MFRKFAMAVIVLTALGLLISCNSILATTNPKVSSKVLSISHNKPKSIFKSLVNSK